MSEIRFPHCDARVLHPPGECQYCDDSGLQEVRACWGIAFTGQKPEGDQVPCPANEARSDESLYSWRGNRPQAKGYVTCSHGNSYDPDLFRCIKCNPSPRNSECEHRYLRGTTPDSDEHNICVQCGEEVL